MKKLVIKERIRNFWLIFGLSYAPHWTRTYVSTQHTEHMIVTHHWQSVYWNVGVIRFISELQISHCLDGHSLDLYFLTARDNDKLFFLYRILLCALSSALRWKKNDKTWKTFEKFHTRKHKVEIATNFFSRIKNTWNKIKKINIVSIKVPLNRVNVIII